MTHRAGAARGRRPAALAVGVALAATACGTAGDPPDLAGRTFVATAARGHEIHPGTEISLSFDEDRVAAQAGCNTLTGGAGWDDGSLTVSSPMATTMMGCDEELAEQDTWLVTLLEGRPPLELDGDTLTLGDAETGLTLRARG